jgi:putative phage-type endonuclease
MLINEDEDKHEYDNEIIDTFFHDEECMNEFIETILLTMDAYISENPTAITEPDFHETFIENIKQLFIAQLENDKSENEMLLDNEFEEIEELIEETCYIFYETIIPVRSFSESIILFNPDVSKIKKQIGYLNNIPQPTQRTDEWYEFRRNLITASNAYKAFENQNTQNQLIYEKCCEISNKGSGGPVNINTPFHWGQKYEPISVMIYEDRYNTKIGDFGCIKHPEYTFLGASPDGINIDENTDRYGRMLEIKNIVNREIDGIPKKEYWVQMQLQMETCNLDECDFLETMFVEYSSEKEFLEDGSFFISSENEMKGIIMYFNKSDGNPHYIYKPLYMDKEEFQEWEENHIDNMNMTWIKNIYWRLKICSCILVQRNERWFKDNIDQLKNIWSIIERERKEGFEHRAPNKRIKNEINSEQEIKGCLLKIRSNTIDETKECTNTNNLI